MTRLQGNKIFLTSKKEKQIIAKYEGMKKGNKFQVKALQRFKRQKNIWVLPAPMWGFFELFRPNKLFHDFLKEQMHPECRTR